MSNLSMIRYRPKSILITPSYFFQALSDKTDTINIIISTFFFFVKFWFATLSIDMSEWPSTILVTYSPIMLRSRGECYIYDYLTFFYMIIKPSYTNLKSIVDLSIIVWLKAIWYPFHNSLLNIHLKTNFVSSSN